MPGRTRWVSRILSATNKPFIFKSGYTGQGLHRAVVKGVERVSFTHQRNKKGSGEHLSLTEAKPFVIYYIELLGYEINILLQLNQNHI
ncbi:MAG: hypothetical protein A2173_11765 [Planctomycetes bacterium RBG_13_44_8b]|nr:MAG: hypothetical protein A2173_11765 [Planctomycetes bacterium RBG_13_44_8b]